MSLPPATGHVTPVHLQLLSCALLLPLPITVENHHMGWHKLVPAPGAGVGNTSINIDSDNTAYDTIVVRSTDTACRSASVQIALTSRENMNWATANNRREPKLYTLSYNALTNTFNNLQTISKMPTFDDYQPYAFSRDQMVYNEYSSRASARKYNGSTILNESYPSETNTAAIRHIVVKASQRGMKRSLP